MSVIKIIQGLSILQQDFIVLTNDVIGVNDALEDFVEGKQYSGYYLGQALYNGFWGQDTKPRKKVVRLD
jgi:hypothetical protein